MFCVRCKAIISNECCLKRQQQAKTEKINYIKSLLNCVDCPQGKELLKKNKIFLSRDVNKLKKTCAIKEKEKQMEKDSNKKQVEGLAVFDLLTNYGIINEVNRSFFHPLGLELLISPSNQLVLYKETQDCPIRFEKIDKLRQSIFNGYSQEQYERRRDKLGYIIQTQDSFATHLKLNKMEKTFS